MMRTLKKLEARIKMLECGVNRGHLHYDGCVISSLAPNTAIKITLTCIRCGYELIKSASELNAKEKEAAIRLGLIPKEKKDG